MQRLKNMRRRVSIFFISVLAILLMLYLGVVLLYHSGWAKKLNYDVFFTAEQLVELKGEEHEESFGVIYGYGDDVLDLEVDVQEIKGAVDVTVYAGQKKPSDDLSEIVNPDCEIMSFQVNEAGKTSYRITDKGSTAYAMCYRLTEDSEYAKIYEKCYSWSTNWDCLMEKFGMKKNEKIGIDALKRAME
ncbi:MAG: hypothetical protein NC240_10520 [Clostridium sp.]|nr:hypothetical protein [Clostridium sp.]